MAKFRTRARAVDMLGRQQIAGIPSAINELFKNAHDAYATEAVVDFFRSDRLFVLRDNGVGMSRTDFVGRWLTLGTESKIEGTPLAPPRGQKRRAVLGEKGIGRLAIAAIGPQVLAVTRAADGDSLGKVTVAYLHWGLFELPGVDLDEIEIPIRTMSDLPDSDVVAGLVAKARENLRDVSGRNVAALVDRIDREMKSFADVSPAELDATLEGSTLRGGTGTHFYVRPASELLARDLDDPDSVEALQLLRTLVGFSNTMTPRRPPVVMETKFLHHYADDAWSDVIGEGEFFTPDDFSTADHHIAGTFDEFGQFQGEISVYGGDAEAFTVAWPSARGDPTMCGPFRFDLAYVQGVRAQSTLEPDAWTAVIHKLDRYGGLYVYRDGIRVLPYGNADFDWLEVERRRTISASDAFFSYRRMVGAVQITREHNSALREKAGREGFATNTAYRQLREILMNFLYRVAFEYFREAGTRSEAFQVRRRELERLDKARARRAAQVRPRIAAVRSELTAFFAATQDDTPRSRTEDLLARLDARVEAALREEDVAEAAHQLVAAEMTARKALDEVRNEYAVRRPRGVGLPRSLDRMWREYELARAAMEDEIFAPALERIEHALEGAAQANRVAVDRRVRFDRAVELVTDSSRDRARVERRELQAAGKETADQAVKLANEALATVETAIQDILAQASRLDVSVLDDEDFVQQRSSLEDEARQITEEQTRALESVTAQLRAIVWPQNGSGEITTGLDEVEALEADLEALKERVEADLELTQLGLSIEIINHEFRALTRSVRRNVQRMAQWADKNPGLREPVQDLRASFEHLDAYLKVFTPLHRRAQRVKVRIDGRSIHKYLRDLFGKRMRDSSITLETTRAFMEHRIEQYPSTIFPVFVNLVDNAMFWLSQHPGERRILLDAGRDWMSITDSGPGVPEALRDEIFELGFSEKPGGTGLGLYIARQVLKKEDMALELAEGSADAGARFIIWERKT